MPKLSHPYEQQIRRAIRDAYALDPIITQTKLLEYLEKRFNKTFDHRYVTRLVNKVSKEAMPDLDREKIEPRLKEIRELFRVGRENLLQIAFDTKGSTPNERTTAWRTIAMLQKLQLDAEIDLGVYNKTKAPDALDAFRWRPVPEELVASIGKAMQQWRLPTDLMRKIGPPVSIAADVLDAKPAQFVEKNANPTTAAESIPSQIGPRPDPVLE